LIPYDPNTTNELSGQKGKEEGMSVAIEIIPDPDEGGFTASIPDIPAYGEGDTEEAAINDLKDALRAFIEAAGLDEALSRIRPRGIVREVDFDLAELVRG
jgi:predicted RNase H-like HicB family nuclease